MLNTMATSYCVDIFTTPHYFKTMADMFVFVCSYETVSDVCLGGAMTMARLSARAMSRNE